MNSISYLIYKNVYNLSLYKIHTSGSSDLLVIVKVNDKMKISCGHHIAVSHYTQKLPVHFQKL
jgi:hypothetical protein